MVVVFWVWYMYNIFCFQAIEEANKEFVDGERFEYGETASEDVAGCQNHDCGYCEV